MLLKFIFRLRNKERIILIDLETIKDKLGVSYALASLPYLLSEHEWLD